jgi:hypothetical protein
MHLLLLVLSGRLPLTPRRSVKGDERLGGSSDACMLGQPLIGQDEAMGWVEFGSRQQYWKVLSI